MFNERIFLPGRGLRSSGSKKTENFIKIDNIYIGKTYLVFWSPFLELFL